MGFLDRTKISRVRDGRTHHLLYPYWKRMLTVAYKKGGEENVCQEWLDFWNFVEDVLPLYEQSEQTKMFGRKDANHGWHKENVLFTNDPREFSRKRSIRYQGKTVYELQRSLDFKLHHKSIVHRIQKGQSLTVKPFGFNIKNIKKEND